MIGVAAKMTSHGIILAWNFVTLLCGNWIQGFGLLLCFSDVFNGIHNDARGRQRVVVCVRDVS